MAKVRVGVAGFGVIGQRLADGVALQEDMELVGVADVAPTLAVRALKERGMPYKMFAAAPGAEDRLAAAGIPVSGTFADLLGRVDIMLDAAPGGIGAKNKEHYVAAGLKAVSRRYANVLPSSWAGHFRTPWESARSFMNLHWQSAGQKPDRPETGGCCSSGDEPYHVAAADGFTISCMPFQDVWSIDLERVQKCCGHVVTEYGRILPFCTYYLTDRHGRRLYPSPESPGRGHGKAAEHNG